MKKMILGVLLVMLLVTVSFVYAAANTVPVTGAGDGEEVISGYAVTDVHYELYNSDPSKIDSVAFSLTPIDDAAPDPTTVKVKLIQSGSTWYPCTYSVSTWSCSIGGAVSVLDADELRVVAAQ